MDLEKWTVLLRALDRGSLSAAAEELGYTPSGVSRAVASLEEELGVPLLARLHRGVAPTRECQALLPMAREMVHLSSLLAQRSDELRGLVSGSLSVGTAYHHYYPWLSRMIAGFTHRYPGVTINLLEGTSSELCQAVRERRADLCIASRREGPFRWTPIHEGPLVVLVPERHPLAEGDRVIGPCPADTVFLKARSGEVGGVVFLYHDQGNIAMKSCFFGDGVLIYTGVPANIVSVGHGPAYGKAGKGTADPKNMISSMEVLRELVMKKKT